MIASYAHLNTASPLTVVWYLSRSITAAAGEAASISGVFVKSVATPASAITKPFLSRTQAIEGLDIEAAMAKLDDDTVTSDAVKELFAALGDKAKVSSSRVAGLPSAQLSLAELQESKEHLQAKLEHLRSAGQVFAFKSVDGNS